MPSTNWYRSEAMEYISLIVNEDAAHQCINDLGRLGVIQFTDLNPELTPFQRRYMTYIKRCDELERKLRFLKKEVDKFGLNTENPHGVEGFLQTHTLQGKDARTGAYLLEHLETTLGNFEKELIELNGYNEKISKEYNDKVEFQEVLSKCRGFFVTELPRLASGNSQGSNTFSDGFQEMEGGNSRRTTDRDMRFSFTAGVLNMSDKTRFERMLFRATRGNCYVRFQEIERKIVDAMTGEESSKAVFIIYYKAEQIEKKISVICNAFNAHRYSVPDMDDTSAVNQITAENQQELSETYIVLQKNKDERFRICTEMALHIEEWQWTVMREKSIYHTMNLFKSNVTGMLHGEGWLVSSAMSEAKAALGATQRSGNWSTMPCILEQVPKPWPTPPTYFQTNKYTVAFQEFVNTYGIPRYQEINPAIFTAASFPFIFGVMYGDIGHGTILLLGSLYLLLTPKKGEERKADPMVKNLYVARYMLTLMSVMAIYAGLIYNDYFSLPLNIFGSKWEWTGHETGDLAKLKNGVKYGEDESVYPFGVDPMWHVSGNELLFFNSMKMKMAVIIGVIQMTFGILLRGLNNLYFKDYVGFFLEFLPMLYFDLALFGYMVFLILYKWSINWDERMLWGTCFDGTSFTGQDCDSDQPVIQFCKLGYGGQTGGCQPPNLVSTLINIALKPGEVDEPMFANQGQWQMFLLCSAGLMVPILLLGKPYVNSLLNQKEKIKSDHHGSFSSDSHLIEDKDGNDHEEHGFGEELIHQGIETIEYVLGMVSNTASYLRLWALSLAHVELSGVFWKNAMASTINSGNPVMIFIGYSIFAGCTFGVIMVMDVLECFLHALRLHWVEFQNKFYKADGYRFEPFSISSILSNAEI